MSRARDLVLACILGGLLAWLLIEFIAPEPAQVVEGVLA